METTTQGVDDKRGNRAAAIDLDGVILDGMKYHINAWREAFAAYEIELDSRQLYLLEGIKTRDVIDRICERFDMDLPVEERDVIARTKKRVYQALFKPTPLEGADRFLDTLYQYDYRLAIVTGTLASSATATLDILGMRDHIDVIVSADLNIPGKPSPAPFREAVERLHVRTDHCLAIDNAPAGITSALAAGLPCVGVATYLRKSDLCEARAVFGDIAELTSWIDAEYQRSAGRGAWITE